MDFIEIEIINWAKYNPRKDYKRPWWFALNNRITQDPEISRLSAEEFKAFIHILCLASQQGKSQIKVDLEHESRISLISRCVIMNSLIELQKYNVIRIVTAICTDSVQNLYGTLHNRTIQNTNVQTAVRTIQPVQFDFNAVYQKYPRKQGKQLGIKRCLAQIKTQKSYDDLLLAIENYKKYLAENKIEKQYVKMFSTFMTSWKDYLDQDFGQFSLEQKLEGYPTERIGDLRWDLPVSDPRHPRHGVVKD